MVCKQECSVAITLCQAMLVQGTCVKLSNTKNVQVSLGEWQKSREILKLKKNDTLMKTTFYCSRLSYPDAVQHFLVGHG